MQNVDDFASKDKIKFNYIITPISRIELKNNKT